jgi:GNAT superfamily N-acetyltransferase
MDINKAILVTKPGSELTDSELNQINTSLFREFKVPPPTKDYLQDKLFFLLKNGDEILAMGALWEVAPVVFNQEVFSIVGFIEVIANVKLKGYGKRVVGTMREYLATRNKTAFGFTLPKNIGFYEKCGFKIETASTQRFVYMKDGKRITNQDGQVIFYQDCSDKFMEKVLANKELEVSIPTDGLW